MKTIDIKSLLLGVVFTTLILTLTSGKTSENNEVIDFVTTPTGVGIYNKATRTIYLYKVTSTGAGIQDNPANVYKVAEDGSSLSKNSRN